MESEHDDCAKLWRVYADARFADHEKQHAAEARALDAAHSALQARLGAMNEFRAAITDQAGTFASRQEVDKSSMELDRRLAHLTEQVSRMVTREYLELSVRERNSRIDGVVKEAQRAAIAAGVSAGVLGLVGGVILILVLTP